MKNKRQSLLLGLSIPGQEILKLYTIFSLLLLIPERTPVPLISLSVMFFIPFILVKLTSLIRMRNISRIIIHLLFFSFSLMLSLTLYPDLPFYGADNLQQFEAAFLQLDMGKTVLCFALIVIAGSVAAIRGILLARRVYTHDLILMNFESGLVIFASIYFLRLGMGMQDSMALNVTSSYFLFALIALATSMKKDESGPFLSSAGQMRFSLAISGILIFLIFLGIIITLYPVAGSSARGLYSLATHTLSPLVPYLIAVLRFLFSLGRPRNQVASPMENDTAAPLTAVPGESPLWLIILERILTWGLLSIVALTALVLIIYIIYKILIFLYSPANRSNGGLSLGEFIRSLLLKFSGACVSLFHRIRVLAADIHNSRANKNPDGLRAFSKLCSWGKRAGLPKFNHETPAEYSRRLALWAGKYTTAINTICNAVQDEIYAGRTIRDKEQKKLRKAVVRLGTIRSLPKRASIRLKKTLSGSSRTD